MIRHNNTLHNFVRGMVKAKHEDAKQSILAVLPVYGQKSYYGYPIKGMTVRQIYSATHIPQRQISGYLRTLKAHKLVIYTKGTWKKLVSK